jgi:hypothetical protein
VSGKVSALQAGGYPDIVRRWAVFVAKVERSEVQMFTWLGAFQATEAAGGEMRLDSRCSQK